MTPRFCECAVGRHEAFLHRGGQLGRLADRLARPPVQDLGVGDEVAMHCGGKSYGEFDGSVVGDGAEFEFRHGSSAIGFEDKVRA